MKTVYQLHVGKLGQSWEIDFDALPQVSKEYIIQRGFDHMNDCHAGIHMNAKDKDGNARFESEEEMLDAVAEAVENRVNALKAGEIGNRGETGTLTRLSPIDTILHKMVEESMLAKLRAQGGKKKSFTKEEWNTKRAELVAANREKLLPEAERQLAAKPNLDIDFGI